MDLPKVGDYIFSKNGTEFYSKVRKINGNKVTISFNNGDYDQEETINISAFKRKCDGDWDMPNWTFGFKI